MKTIEESRLFDGVSVATIRCARLPSPRVVRGDRLAIVFGAIIAHCRAPTGRPLVARGVSPWTERGNGYKRQRGERNAPGDDFFASLGLGCLAFVATRGLRHRLLTVAPLGLVMQIVALAKTLRSRLVREPQALDRLP